MNIDLSNINLPNDYTQSPELESSMMDWLREKYASLSSLSLEEIFNFEFCLKEDFDYSEYILTKRLKAILREMTIRMYNNVCAVKSSAHSLLGTISLLFGLCCSQSSIIFRAFYGASLSRIPA